MKIEIECKETYNMGGNINVAMDGVTIPRVTGFCFEGGYGDLPRLIVTCRVPDGKQTFHADSVEYEFENLLMNRAYLLDLIAQASAALESLGEEDGE